MRLKQLFHTLETLEMSDFATEKPCKQTESIQRKCNVPHVARNVWPSATCGPALYAPSLRTFFSSKQKNTFFILLSTRLSLSLYKIGGGSGEQTKKTLFHFALHSPFTIFVHR